MPRPTCMTGLDTLEATVLGGQTLWSHSWELVGFMWPFCRP